MVAVVTLGNTPNTDISVSDNEGNQFVDNYVRLGTVAKRSSGDYSTSVVFSQRAVVPFLAEAEHKALGKRVLLRATQRG